MALYRPIHTPLDYELLQKDIDAISRWISACYSHAIQCSKVQIYGVFFSIKRSIDAPPNTLFIHYLMEFPYKKLMPNT